MKWYARSEFHIAFLVVCTLLVYGNTLSNDLVWDDVDFIHKWDGITTFDLKSYFEGDVPSGHQGVYRPMRSVYYYTAHAVLGKSSVGYHALALIIHLVNVVLLFFLVGCYTKNKWIPFVASLIFAIHPIHTESVSFVAAAFDLIGICFFFGALLLHARGKKWWSLTCATLAFFSYELTLTLPLFIILQDWLSKKKLKTKITTYVAYFTMAALYFIVRFIIVDTASRGSYIENIVFTLMLSSFALMWYVITSIVPFGLSVNKTLTEGILAFRLDTVTLGITKVNVWHVFAIILAACALLYVAYKYRNKNRFVSFSIVWFFIALIPVSNVIPQSALYGEKYAYIASLGVCLLLAYAVVWLTTHKKFRYVGVALCVFLLVFYSYQTIDRNTDWETEETLWRATIDASPLSLTAHNRLGLYYLDTHDIDRAFKHFKTTVQLDANYAQGHSNLGIIYGIKRDYPNALASYMSALTINPQYGRAYYNLAMLHAQMGDAEAAWVTYEAGKKHAPHDAEKAKALLMKALS